MNCIQQHFSVFYTHKVHFTYNLFHPENRLFLDVLSGCGEKEESKILFVIDRSVTQSHPLLEGNIMKYFNIRKPKATLVGQPLIVEGGEVAKNNKNILDKVLDRIEANGLCRHSYLAVIGGGAVLDMAGFAASIAHRGIKLIRIPTTVLSQNDSGVGVKNGINAYGKKNFLGTFCPPTAVVNDLMFLESLEERDFRAGISEAIKVALLKDVDFYRFIEANCDRLINRDPEIIKILIYRCAELHMDHIASGDPFELGSSRPLDFGHWAAHKLEQLSNNNIKHGEAVAAGLALDCTYSMLDNMLDEESWQKILLLLKRLGFQLFYSEMECEIGHSELMEGLEEFREHLGGQLTVMLLEEIGKGKEVHHIDKRKVMKAMEVLMDFEMVYSGNLICQI
ncbi:3-dehydroquinate synthase [Cytophagaceae bacterium ABcell3]|nr:3-dehydroquinate synthase [Cytophagaceae bacterium ABcell3]